MQSELTSSSGVRLIRLTPGSFIMGSPPDEAGDEYWQPERQVTLPYEFYLAATPVTQRQFARSIRTFAVLPPGLLSPLTNYVKPCTI
jgi:formylglycine-generating enzyme required for sulfatase activity